MVSNDKTNISKVKNLLNGFVSYYLILFHRHDPSSIKSNSVSKPPKNSVFVLISRNGNFRSLAKNWTKIEEFNAWRISTTPNTTKIFLIIFKLIQQAIMVILSCLVKKNQNLNSRKKSSVYY